MIIGNVNIQDFYGSVNLFYPLFLVMKYYVTKWENYCFFLNNFQARKATKNFNAVYEWEIR